MRTATVFLLVLASTALAQDLHPVERARALEQSGDATAAFYAWLAIDGAEYQAVRIARRDPMRYLSLLGRTGPEVPAWRTGLIAGDCLLRLGKTEQALELYRSVAGHYSGTGRYPVEPARQSYYPVRPFETGPGSHRDNWLIRRFLAMGEMADAGREFERLRRIHEPRSGEAFSSSGLLFTLDHAFFLLRAGRDEDAFAALAAPVLVMDMDRNQGWSWGRRVGATRKEFIRIALGVLKEAGRAESIVAAVEEQVEEGEARAMRVLAEIRRQQERSEEARELELRYLDEGGLPELSLQYRRGQILEAANRIPEAVLAYESALRAPWTIPVLPEEEPGRSNFTLSQQNPAMIGWPPLTEQRFKAGILSKLERLYGSLGRTEDMLDALLLEIEYRGERHLSLDHLQRTAERFVTGDRLENFNAWARRLAATDLRPDYVANLHFMVGDYAAAAQAVARVMTTTKLANADYLQWMRSEFRKAGEEPLRLLLKAAVGADPGDARSRLELLLLDDDLDGENVMTVMREVLTGEARYDFGRPRAKGRRIDFGSPYHLALRLMRLYEQHGRFADIVELGLLIARGDEPFFAEREAGRENRYYYGSGSGSGARDLANACLARAVQHAEADQLAALEALLEDSPWTGALAQVRRRRAGGVEFEAAAEPFGFANLPDGVVALAGNEFVLTIAADERYVYAGMPYGIAVYDHDGNAVTRVALQDCGLAIAARDGLVWVGGTGGLYRVVRDEWTVGHIRLDRDLSGKRSEDEFHRDNRVLALALDLDGDQLWIAVRGTVQVLQGLADTGSTGNTANLTLRTFAPEEVEIENLFLIEEDYVWADDEGSGIYRYDRKTETWTRVPGNHRELELIGDIDGSLIASVNLGDPIRRRPCIIDRKTLEVTPIFFESPDPERPIMINHEMSFFGYLDGFAVLGAESPRYLFDAEKNSLREIPGIHEGGLDRLVSEIPQGLPTGDYRRHPDGRISTDYIAVLVLAGGTRVVGRTNGNTPRYKYRNEDWPFELFQRGRASGAGGLTFLKPGEPARRVSSIPRSDSILGPEVLCMTRDAAGRVWLGTRAGLAVLDREFRVVARFTEADGLLTNRIDGAAAFGGKLYFASGWGPADGGLTVYDPATGVFTSLLSEDSLPVSKLVGVSADDNGLLLTPGVVVTDTSGPWEHRLIPPFRFDPGTGSFTDPGPGEVIGGRAAERISRGERGPAMPILDGRVLATHELGDRRLILGTRGVLEVQDGMEPKLAIEEIEVPLVRARRAALVADAKQRRARFKTAKELEQLLQDENPFFRADALRAAGNRENPEFVPVAARHLDDPELRVRASALYLLTRIDDGELVVPHLKRVLSDPTPVMRAHATIQLCRHGAPPDPAFLEDILTRRGGLPALPAGCTGTANLSADKLEIYEAVAPHATAGIFAVLLDHPLGNDDYEPRVKARKELGESLAAHPEAVPILMAAKTPDQIRFVQAVCGNAGAAILPVLLEQLESDDRVRRSNAALALGAVGDPAAIPHLLTALDRESGLSRAGAVRALGDLKARAALPRLTELYLAARSDPGGGYRAGQADFGYRREVERIESMAAIARQWDELTAAVIANQPRPGRGERLLTPALILDAIRRIGPEASQEFYRRLAADSSHQARREAAIGLVACLPDSVPQTVTILDSLLMDTDGFVRAQAAVSLAMLGRESGRAALTRWLEGTDRSQQERALRALLRVRDGSRFEFVFDRVVEIGKDRAEPEGIRRYARKVLGYLAD